MRMHLVEFNEQERKGYALFKQHCNRCHTEPLFTNGQFANNVLPVDTTLNDLGDIESRRIAHISDISRFRLYAIFSILFPIA
jgi:cytochrome c peroxidase